MAWQKASHTRKKLWQCCQMHLGVRLSRLKISAHSCIMCCLITSLNRVHCDMWEKEPMTQTGRHMVVLWPFLQDITTVIKYPIMQKWNEIKINSNNTMLSNSHAVYPIANSSALVVVHICSCGLNPYLSFHFQFQLIPMVSMCIMWDRLHFRSLFLSSFPNTNTDNTQPVKHWWNQRQNSKINGSYACSLHTTHITYNFRYLFRAFWLSVHNPYYHQ